MDLESTRLQLEDELEAKAELQKTLVKIQEETRHLRDRYEKELEAKNEEIEDHRYLNKLSRKQNSLSMRNFQTSIQCTYHRNSRAINRCYDQSK